MAELKYSIHKSKYRQRHSSVIFCYGLAGSPGQVKSFGAIEYANYISVEG